MAPLALSAVLSREWQDLMEQSARAARLSNMDAEPNG